MSDLEQTKTEPPVRSTGDRGLSDLGEDATGFGRLELRTIWHALIRPAAVLEAYMTHGPTGGGLYSRPLRLYLGLCGFLTLVLFLQGGTTDMLTAQLPPELIDPLIARSGKSRDLFLADTEGWVTLVTVPVVSAFYALFAAPLIRLWDPAHLGWRRAFRATFAYLNTWTIPMLPFALIAYRPDLALISMVIIIALSIAAFLRAGKSRWYRTRVGGVVKAVVFALVLQIASLVAGLPVGAIGILGGVYGA